MLRSIRKSYTLILHHISNFGKDNSHDGAQIDHADDDSHDQFTNGLLVTGHAALSGDAGPQGGDGQGQGQDQNGQDVGEGRDDGRVEVILEVGAGGVAHVQGHKGIGAGVGQFFVVQKVDGHCCTCGDQKHDGNEDFVGNVGAEVVVVQLGLLSSLQNNNDVVESNFSTGAAGFLVPTYGFTL